MKKNFYLGLVLLAFFFINSSCNHLKNQQNDFLVQKIDSLLGNRSEKPFNGIILVTSAGETKYFKMSGFADLENEIPFKINDQFVIGSISKQFTAEIVLEEYDKKNLGLNTPIIKYLPDLTQSWADTVTVHHLLTHTHGIISLDKPTIFPVGTQYDYSQIGYDLLAQIVEKTSGKSFIELSSELFETCEMNNTFHPQIGAHKNLVKGYMEDEDEVLKYTDQSLKQYAAAGGFISSVEDLAQWNTCFFEKRMLSENTFKLMTTKHDRAVRNHPVFGLTEYGYGITVDDREGIVQWGQTGFASGFVSMNFYFPKSKTSVIVLENVNYDLSDLKKTFYYHSEILNVVRGLLSDSKKNSCL